MSWTLESTNLEVAVDLLCVKEASKHLTKLWATAMQVERNQRMWNNSQSLMRQMLEIMFYVENEVKGVVVDVLPGYEWSSQRSWAKPFVAIGFIDVWRQFSYDSGCSVDMQHVGVQDACIVYSNVSGSRACTVVAIGDAWGPNMACLLLHVVIAALTTGALGAPCPNNTVSFNIMASTLLLVCDVLHVNLDPPHHHYLMLMNQTRRS